MDERIKGLFENLTDEQKERVKACKSPEEFMKLAGEWGIELPDEALDAAAGGIPIFTDPNCPALNRG